MSRTSNASLAGVVIATLLLFTAGCTTTVCDLQDVSATPPINYRDDTPANLIDSYLLAWNAYDDDDVYHFRTPLNEQNETEKQAFIDNGANKCRWIAEYWAIVNEAVTEEGQSATLDVLMVESSEGYTTLCTLRFKLEREGGRWLVSSHEWVGESTELRNYFPLSE